MEAFDRFEPGSGGCGSIRRFRLEGSVAGFWAVPGMYRFSGFRFRGITWKIWSRLRGIPVGTGMIRAAGSSGKPRRDVERFQNLKVERFLTVEGQRVEWDASLFKIPPALCPMFLSSKRREDRDTRCTSFERFCPLRHDDNVDKRTTGVTPHGWTTHRCSCPIHFQGDNMGTTCQ